MEKSVEKLGEVNSGISVIICCFNSSKRLPQTLRHLANQNVTEVDWEVVLVDNNSSDNTKDVAISEWDQYNINVPLRVVEEATQGLSAARERGVQESKYEYLVFCDDDNWLASDYLNEAYLILNKDKKIGAAGGWSEAASNVEIPDWFHGLNGYAVGRQAPESGDLVGRYHLWGAGLATRKSLMTKVFSTRFLLTDRKENVIVSGGDSEICARLILMGFKLYYSESLYFKHFIPKERLTKEYRVKLLQGFETTKPAIEKYFEFIESKKESFFSKLKYTVMKGVKILILNLMGKGKKHESHIAMAMERIAIYWSIKTLSKITTTQNIVDFISTSKKK